MAMTMAISSATARTRRGCLNSLKCIFVVPSAAKRLSGSCGKEHDPREKQDIAEPMAGSAADSCFSPVTH
jgi:hypothetical protein